MDTLTIEHLQEALAALPKPRAKTMLVIHIDDALDFLRLLRTHHIPYRRAVGAGGKRISMFYIFPDDQKLLVDMTRTITRGQMIEMPDPDNKPLFDLRRPIKLDLPEPSFLGWRIRY
jgi:hypothetical protein